MNPEKYKTSMQRAAAIVAAFSADLKAADQLAGSTKNNSIHEQTATSRNILASRRPVRSRPTTTATETATPLPLDKARAPVLV